MLRQLRTTVKLTFALLAVWLGLVWAGLLPRPAFLPPELDIEPLTFLLGTIAALLFGFWKNNDAKSEAVTGGHRLTEPDESINAEIRKYLKSRYEHRIRQKLAGREPVNLRKIPSSTGTSGEGAQNFITLPAEKVPSGMAELFDEARGRLLVVGAPGAGKTISKFKTTRFYNFNPFRHSFRLIFWIFPPSPPRHLSQRNVAPSPAGV